MVYVEKHYPDKVEDTGNSSVHCPYLIDSVPQIP